MLRKYPTSRERVCVITYPYFSDGVKITKPLQDQNVFEKDEVVLSCEVSNDSAKALWYKNDKPVVVGKKTIAESIGNVRSLTLPWCEISDSGKYKVIVKYGESSANLIVKGI